MEHLPYPETLYMSEYDSKATKRQLHNPQPAELKQNLLTEARNKATII